MIYKPEGFALYELLPRSFHEKYKSYEDKLWLMFDYRMLWTLSQLRKRYGTTIMNTWWWMGKHQYRGWRPWNCEVGAMLSQHKFGRAADCVFKRVTAEEVREDIKAQPDHPDFHYITCLEEDTNWLHFDCRDWLREEHGILIVRP